MSKKLLAMDPSKVPIKRRTFRENIHVEVIVSP